MTIDATSARHREWKRISSKLAELTADLETCQPRQRQALERAIAAAEEDLLDTPAPSFGAVRTKLELLFEGQLEGLDQEAEHRRLVLEDLSDLIAETRDLLGERA